MVETNGGDQEVNVDRGESTSDATNLLDYPVFTSIVAYRNDASSTFPRLWWHRFDRVKRPSLT